MGQINRNNKIFTSAEFQKDKYKFYIALKILKDNQAKIYSDEENYAIMQMSANLPIWIWTKDQINYSCCAEIIEILNLYYNKKAKITCKKEFYNLLVDHKIKVDNYFEMGTLYCKSPIAPREFKGKMEQAQLRDLDILSQYWYDDYVEMEDENYSLKQAQDLMKEMIEEGNFYVLRNQDHKIVCMARYTCIDDVASLNKVYTPIEERRKGYCANLIYHLSKMLLEKGITPMLYTDYNYIPSNKAYINVGYIKDGSLATFYLKED